MSSLPLTSLCFSVASPTQTVNTDSGCGDMIANANWRKLVSMLVMAWVICLQSSLFALPSRGSAGPCRGVRIQSDNFGFLCLFKEDLNSDMNSAWSVEGVPKWAYFLINNTFLFTQTKKKKQSSVCLTVLGIRKTGKMMLKVNSWWIWLFPRKPIYAGVFEKQT